MGVKEVPSKILPYTPAAGDPYLLGTCYDRAAITQEWEIDTSDLPYLAHVKSLADRWKPLRYLADWLEVGTTPLRWNDVREKPNQRNERTNRTTVTMLQFFGSAPTKRLDIDKISTLKEALQEATPEEPSLQLFLVEDLSRQVVESLGARYDIDPLFFRDQIADYNWFNTRDPWAMSPSLLAEMKHRNWFHLRNVRLRYFKSRKSFETARWETNWFNVYRRYDNDENHSQYQDAEGSIIGMSRTRSSFWVGKDPLNPNTTVGIVLLDPSIVEGYLLWHGPTNWVSPPPGMNEKYSPTKNPSSLLEQIIEATTTYPWYHSDAKSTPIDQQIFVKPAIYAICAEWLIVCDYIKSRLGQLEWELEKPSVFRSKGDAVEGSLQRLHTWRRVVPLYREMVKETIEQAFPAAIRLTSTSNNPNPYFQDIFPDFQRVQQSLNELQERVDRLTTVVTSEISTVDSRRGLEENHNLSRLTWLATTFIPLSFVCGLFSMQEDIVGMKTTFGWYFLTAIPLTALCMVVAGGVGKNWWRKKPKANDPYGETRNSK
ncbi:hypothetical protein B0J11DRAFT_429256 [Dendryphion nanum]|uniref:Uncharacterized protein n=1 Tax=Dendryphion nanum TaxID=256645 RepID=A0A9P9IRV6_9PLEO|nr:hypothetical protein B0J11DRAFT_429256 [Dendryphion nanum]